MPEEILLIDNTTGAIARAPAIADDAFRGVAYDRFTGVSLCAMRLLVAAAAPGRCQSIVGGDAAGTGSKRFWTGGRGQELADLIYPDGQMSAASVFGTQLTVKARDGGTDIAWSDWGGDIFRERVRPLDRRLLADRLALLAWAKAAPRPKPAPHVTAVLRYLSAHGFPEAEGCRLFVHNAAGGVAVPSSPDDPRLKGADVEAGPFTHDGVSVALSRGGAPEPYCGPSEGWSFGWELSPEQPDAALRFLVRRPDGTGAITGGGVLPRGQSWGLDFTFGDANEPVRAKLTAALAGLIRTYLDDRLPPND